MAESRGVWMEEQKDGSWHFEQEAKGRKTLITRCTFLFPTCKLLSPPSPHLNSKTTTTQKNNTRSEIRRENCLHLQMKKSYPPPPKINIYLRLSRDWRVELGSNQSSTSDIFLQNTCVRAYDTHVHAYDTCMHPHLCHWGCSGIERDG